MLRNLICLGLVAMASPSFAADPPDFLKGKKYATAPQACSQVGENDELVLDEFGIAGFEFVCRFVDFAGQVDVESGEKFLYVSRMNCGDDSGINRPDLATLIPQPDGSAIFVQSQNEYVISEATRQAMINANTFDTDKETDFAFVSQEYRLCK